MKQFNIPDILAHQRQRYHDATQEGKIWREQHMNYALGLIKHIEDDIKAGLTPSQDVLDMHKQAIKDMEFRK